MAEATLNRSIVVNDEPNDATKQLDLGEEAVDGDNNAVITIVRSTAAPTASNIRPYGQLWIRTTTQQMWWSRGGGSWYEFRNTATVPAHQATHRAGGSDPLPWTSINGRGLFSAMPAAATTNAGYLYDATDVKRLYRSTGTTWEVVAGTELASEYTHTQSTPASAWVIVHNLARYPKAVAIRDSAGNVCYGGIHHVDTNQLTITFGHAFSGTATVG